MQPRIDFSGDWTFNKERSSDPDEMLKALGVPWIARTALRRATRTVKIDHKGLAWIEDATTAVITRLLSPGAVKWTTTRLAMATTWITG